MRWSGKKKTGEKGKLKRSRLQLMGVDDDFAKYLNLEEGQLPSTHIQNGD